MKDKMEEGKIFFDRTLKKIEFLFRYAGLNIKSGEPTSKNRLKYRIVFIFNLFWLNVDLAGAIFWVIDGIRTEKDFLALTYISPCISLSTMANFKGFYLMINEKYVHKLIDTLRKLEIRDNGKLSIIKNEIANQEMKILHVVIKTINASYVVVVVFFTLTPLVITAVKYLQTQELDLILPFLVLYPFDPFQLKFWPIVYLHQFWSECVVSLNICAADCFFFTCCTYIRIQFRFLRNDIENIIPKVQSNQIYLEGEEFKNNFKELVKWHQELIESTTLLEKIFSKSTLFNFLLSSLIICFTGFNVTMVNDVSFLITFLCFLFMSLVQVFFLCYFADSLMASSMEISQAVYDSQWYMAEPKIRKKFLLILSRSQKPCQLTASGYADVNLNSFMRVVSTAWSYFALLKTMYGK